MKSKLSDHKFKKGKFITPFNSIPQIQELSDEKSWTYGRMPEYIWIGLIFRTLGRDEGLNKLYKIISELHRLAPELFTARLSQILKLDSHIQLEFYNIIKKRNQSRCSCTINRDNYGKRKSRILRGILCN